MVFSVRILPRGAALLLLAERKRVRPRNFRNTSVSERGNELGYEVKAEDRIKVDGNKGLAC